MIRQGQMAQLWLGDPRYSTWVETATGQRRVTSAICIALDRRTGRPDNPCCWLPNLQFSHSAQDRRVDRFRAGLSAGRFGDDEPPVLIEPDETIGTVWFLPTGAAVFHRRPPFHFDSETINGHGADRPQMVIVRAGSSERAYRNRWGLH